MNDLTLTQLIQEILDEESETAKKAKAMGLTYMKFGRWGKDGKVTHTTQNGVLTPAKTNAVGTNPTAGTTTPTPMNKVQTPATSQQPTIKSPGSFKKDAGQSMYNATYRSISAAGLGNKDAFDKGYVPLTVKSASPKSWSRGDGARHKDWITVEPNSEWQQFDSAKEKDPQVVQKSLQQYIDSTGAKKIGQIKGQFGSSAHNDVYKLGSTLFVNRGDRVEVGSTGRLKNKDVWGFKK
jgi:hypothetical protein